MLNCLRITANMKQSNVSSFSRGFALSEMLLAIGVMFLIAVMTIPMLTMSSGMREIEEKRDAQLLASVCFQAQQAGVNFVVPGSVDPTVKNLLSGGQAPTGRRFQALAITADEASAAARHLRITNGNLVYAPSGR